MSILFPLIDKAETVVVGQMTGALLTADPWLLPFCGSDHFDQAFSAFGKDHGDADGGRG